MKNDLEPLGIENSPINKKSYLTERMIVMLTKICIERNLIFNPSSHVVIRSRIMGAPSKETVNTAISLAVRKYEILNCQVLEDHDGEFFYVPKEKPASPYIEFHDSLSPVQELIHEQERIPFQLESGELQRYIVEDNGEEMILYIVQHPLAGDKTSVLMLLDTIMENMKKIENHEEIAISESDIVPIKLFTHAYLSSKVTLNSLSTEAVSDLNRQWCNDSKRFSLDDYQSLYNNYWSQNQTCIATANISGDTLKNVEKACKEHNVSLSNLILSLVGSSLAKGSKFSISTDLRTEEFTGLGNYSVQTIISSLYDDHLDVWKNASRVQQIVMWKLSDKSQLLADLLFRTSFANGIQDAVHFQAMNMFNSRLVHEFNNLTGNGMKGKHFGFNSIDNSVLKAAYGKNTINEISYFAPLSSNMDCNMSTITVNGNLVLTMHYNKNCSNYAYIFRDVICNLNALGNQTDSSLFDFGLAAM